MNLLSSYMANSPGDDSVHDYPSRETDRKRDITLGQHEGKRCGRCYQECAHERRSYTEHGPASKSFVSEQETRNSPDED